MLKYLEESDYHLLQRLERPRPEMGKVNRVFGGGMLGLTDEAWDLLEDICTVEYMGAAEYEFGKLPECLSTVLQLGHSKKLSTFSFVVGPHERELHFSRKYNRKNVPLPPAGYVRIYGIGHSDFIDKIQTRVAELVADEKKFHVKRGANLPESLDPIHKDEWDYQRQTVGWIDLENCFMFFSDENMWKGFCELFGAEPCTPPALPVSIDYSKLGKPALVNLAVKLGMFRTKTAAKKLKKDVLLEKIQG